MTDQATISQAEEAFRGVLNGGAAPEGEQLLELFSQLEPVSVEAILGLWRVAAFGQRIRDRVAVPPAEGPLPEREGLGMRKLYGKRFVDRDHAEPIVVFDPDSGSLVASVDFGVARVREVAFRGTASAGMVYDSQPWIDYFRKVDDDTLVGLIDMKGSAIDTAFFLVRG